MSNAIKVISTPVYSDVYSGNPLKGVLPKEFNKAQLMQLLSVIPIIPKNLEVMTDEERVEKQLEIDKFVIPTSLYFDIYYDLRLMILRGYSERNPILPTTIEWTMHVATNGLQNIEETESTIADSSFLVGISGMGKSTLAARILNNCFPQLIFHPSQPTIVNPQILWVKFDLPADAARSSVCKAFFRAVDKILNKVDSIEMKPNFAKQYSGKKIEDMQDGIANICLTYNIGLIVIDELQRLNIAKGGGEKVVLNFFNNLSNTTKTPILKIGTPASFKLFKGDFESGRRNMTNALYEITPLEIGSNDWDYVVRALWSHQMTIHKTPFTDKIGECLHELTGGVVSCLSRLIKVANVEAIRSGQEKLSVNLLRTVFKKQFPLLKDAIEAIKSGKKKDYEDLMLISEYKEKEAQHKIDLLKKMLRGNNFTGQAAKAFQESVEDVEKSYILAPEQKMLLQKLKKEMDDAIAKNNASIVVNHEGGSNV